MNKKIFLVIFSLLIIVLFTACSNSTEQDPKNELSGYYFKGKSDHVFICDDGEPIIITDLSDSHDLFKDLESYNQIKITVGAVLEEYPCSAGAYECVKVDDNTSKDIPESVKNTLITLNDMGHLSLEDIGF